MTYLKTNKLNMNCLQSSIILCMQDNSRCMHHIMETALISNQIKVTLMKRCLKQDNVRDPGDSSTSYKHLYRQMKPRDGNADQRKTVISRKQAKHAECATLRRTRGTLSITPEIRVSCDPTLGSFMCILRIE